MSAPPPAAATAKVAFTSPSAFEAALRPAAALALAAALELRPTTTVDVVEFTVYMELCFVWPASVFGAHRRELATLLCVRAGARRSRWRGRRMSLEQGIDGDGSSWDVEI